MKNINQFDYPSRQVQFYKNHSAAELNESKTHSQYQKTKYKENLHYHMQMERIKVKENQQKKKQLENKKTKAKISSELQKKRRQLENLEILKQQAQQNQRRAQQLAMLKEEQDRIRKEQEERKKKQFDQNAVNRFETALKRLYQEKQENNFKQRLAQQRRKTADEFQRIQRIKASKYKSFVEQKQKNLEVQEKKSFEEYKKTLGRSAYNKNTDYTKTCLHNPKIIVQNKKSQQDAFLKGKIASQLQREKSQEKRKRNEQNLRRSKQRGKQAFSRIQRQKEYAQFQKETQQEQRRYNLQRIQAGKRNQLIGIKPSTLNQMQSNKKMRSQQEFQKMFFTRPLNITQSFNQPASKYQIVQSRMPHRNNQTMQVSRSKKTKDRAYLKERQQSQIPCVSQGKYSFQEPQYSEFKNQTKSRSHHDFQVNEEDEQNQEQVSQSRGYNVKNAWKETGIPNQKYTSSPEQQRKAVTPFHKQDQVQTSKRSEQKDSFNTDQMLRKYALKKDSPPKKSKHLSSAHQKKRKVVQLANICQNKDHSKEQLSYSQSEQEQDSLN